MSRKIWLFIIAFFLFHSVAYAQSCGCEVSDRKEAAYNELLKLSEAEKENAEQIHLPFGIPQSPSSATNEHIFHQDEYLIMYDDDLRIPLWVAYNLTREHLATPRERTECFRKDIRLSDSAAAFCEDYEEPLFDRGHMVPNADMVRSEAAMINTYMFTNMCPQHDRFNRGIWSRLESRVRKWAKTKGEIYVISGAVFDKDSDEKRDDDSDAIRMKSNNNNERVAIPTHFYKIILHERPNGFIESMTFLLPHTDSSPIGNEVDPFLKSKLVKIDEIEKITGIDFLIGIRDADGEAKERAIENFKARSLWPTE